MDTKKEKRSYAMVLAAGCGLSGSAVGMIMNVAGLFFNPVSDALGIGRAAVSLTLTIAVLCASLSASLIPRILKPRSFRPLLWLGTLSMVGGTALMAAAQNSALLYTASVIRGLGSGLMNFVPITMLLNNWFAARRGVVTSSVMAVSGLTGVLLSPLLSAVLEQLGWRAGFLALALLMLLFNLPALLLPISLRPEDQGLRPYGSEQGTVRGGKAAAVWQTAPAVLLVLAIGYSLFSSFLTGFPQHLPAHAADRGFDADTGALLLSLVMIANVSGKVLYGILADRFGFRRTCLPYLALILFAVAALQFLPGRFWLAAGALCFGLCYALGTAGAVTLTLDLFGQERYSSVYPKLFFVGNTTNALASSFFGLLFDASQDYTSSLLFCGMLTAALLFMIPLAYRLRRKAP